jgi:hypothetical protein
MQINRQVTKAGTKVMQESPQQTQHKQFQQWVGPHLDKLRIGLDRGQAVLQHQEQQRQRTKEQQSTDTMENGYDTGKRQLDLVQSKVFRTLFIHYNSLACLKGTNAMLHLCSARENQKFTRGRDNLPGQPLQKPTQLLS